MGKSFLKILHINLQQYIAPPLELFILNEEDEHMMAFNRFKFKWINETNYKYYM